MSKPEKVRVVSVGERRAWNRLAALVATAALDLRIEPPTAARLAEAVANAARNEGLALTRQVR